MSTDDLRKFIKLTGVAGSELMSDHATDGSKLPHRSDKLQLYDLLHTVHDDEAVPIKGRASQLEGLLAALVHQLSVEKTSEFKPLMMYLLQSNLLQALDFDLGSTGKAFEGFVDMASKGIECLQIVLDTTFSSMKVLPTQVSGPATSSQWTCGHKVGARSESPRRDSTGKWHGSKSDYSTAFAELSKAGACASLVDFEFMIIHDDFWDVAYLYWLLGHAASIAPVFHEKMANLFKGVYAGTS